MIKCRKSNNDSMENVPEKRLMNNKSILTKYENAGRKENV